MAKRKLQKEVYCETENRDEEFYLDFLNTDSDIQSDNIYSNSGSDIVSMKRQMGQLVLSSNSEVEENENENSNINEFTTWRDITHRDEPQSKTNFSTGYTCSLHRTYQLFQILFLQIHCLKQLQKQINLPKIK